MIFINKLYGKHLLNIYQSFLKNTVAGLQYKFYIMQKLLYVLYLLLPHITTIAQTNTQIVRGTVYDKISEKPLQGVGIKIGNSAGTTNENGNYALKNISVGRVSLQATYVGYKTVVIPEILVTSGKEVIIDIGLEQEINNLTDVTVKAGRVKKGNASNEFAGASSRSFSMEEVTRFAGGRNDPSKLVSSFAGVVSNSDSRNDIVVRGNSPTGVLWRLEGLPTPSPNHFSTAGTTGGPVSALNTNALKTSDFYTGAFAAEYGNANAAVFDMQLRTGNTATHEKTLQLNLFSGLEAMLEGPLNNKKNGASYLVGYRYSFVQIGQSFGIDVGTTAIPKYQDWVYNIQFGKSKAGKFSLFGMGGISKIDFLGNETDTTDFYARKDQNSFVKSNFAVFGAKHTIDVGRKSYIKTVASYSIVNNNFQAYQFNLPVDYNTTPWKIVENDNKNNTFRLASFINTKYNAKLNWRTGIVAELFNTQVKVISREGKTSSDNFDIQQDYKGNTALLQAYTQLRYKPTEKITLTAGLNNMFYTLNNTNALQPRAGISYQLNSQNTLQFNYGLHAQMQPMPVYFFQQQIGSTIDKSNKELDFTKAHHFVLAHEIRLQKDWRIKTEVYYQHLFNVPVQKNASGFSMLNAGADFTFPEIAGLVNKGTGRNAGIELTIEKFLSKGFYVLATSSLFSSKYKGSDGVERNTTFNYGNTFNILAGREWKIGKSKNNAFTFDIKLTQIGGRYVTPIDFAASVAANREILDVTKYNTEQLKGYFRLDTKFGVRLNSSKKKFSQTFYLDLQNVTNNKNIFLRRYNAEKQRIGEVNQIGFFPDLLYRITF